MLEALRCVEEGIAPETVDAALVAFGMPMGPVELVDTVGLDIAVAAGKALAGEGAEPPAPRLLRLVAERQARPQERRGLLPLGSMARRSRCRRRGGAGRPARPAAGPGCRARAGRTAAPADSRLASPSACSRRWLAATRRCVEQGVVADADLADAGVIFGTAFAAYGRAVALPPAVRENLNRLAPPLWGVGWCASIVPWHEIDPPLQEMARRGRTAKVCSNQPHSPGRGVGRDERCQAPTRRAAGHF